MFVSKPYNFSGSKFNGESRGIQKLCATSTGNFTYMKPWMFSYIFYAGDWSKKGGNLDYKAGSLCGSDILAEMALRK